MFNDFLNGEAEGVKELSGICKWCLKQLFYSNGAPNIYKLMHIIGPNKGGELLDLSKIQCLSRLAYADWAVPASCFIVIS